VSTPLNDPYLPLVQAFDQLAPAYDHMYGPQYNAVMGWMRQESLALLHSSFPPGSRLLEIGCGTGEEAVSLAQAGCRILATDVSPEMIALTQAKARTAGFSDRVEARVCAAGKLDTLEFMGPFDGAYASFGSLNCEPDLERAAAALGALLKPDAAWVCSVMGRWPLFEILWFALHGQLRQATRRSRRGWLDVPIADDGGLSTRAAVRYLSKQEIQTVFKTHFILERVYALPLLLPPPYLDGFYRRHRQVFDWLAPWERRLRTRWPFYHLGDHIVLVLRRLPH